MPLDEILKNIEDETRKQEEQILEEAKKNADEVIKEAEKKASEIIQGYKKKAKDEGESLKKQMISSAILDNRNKLEIEIERIQDNILEYLNKRLREFVETKEYADFLLQKIKKGWETLGPGVIVYANKKDLEIIKGLSLPVNLVEKDVDPIGGVIISSADGRMEIDYTLSEILRNKSEEIRKLMKRYITG